MTETTPRRIPLMPLAGLGIVLVAGIFAILVSRGAANSTRWADHSARVQLLIAELGERTSDHESSFRGYMTRADGRMLRDMQDAEAAVDVRLADLKREMADSPVQLGRLARLRQMITARFAYERDRVAERDRAGTAAALAQGPRQERAYRLSAGIRAGRRELLRAEQQIAVARQRETQQRISALSLALAAGVLLVVIVAYLTVDDARRRFLEMEAAHDEARAAVAAAEAQIIAREEAEDKLRQSQKMESIGQLTGGIAHDFNNMLAVVIGGLDMARRRIDDRPRLLHSLENAREGAERASALVSRLLAFSRRQPLKPAMIDPNQLVAAMRDMLERTLGEVVRVETRLAPDLWPSYADPLQLENAILNLAVNARDAMGDRGGLLRIATDNVTIDPDEARAHAELVPGDYARIAVRDDGIGMSAEIVARAFDPFFTTKVVGKGTGLGLSQVFGFVKQSGGHVTIESAPGHGTTISLLLPRFAGETGLAETLAEPTIAGITGRTGERILVVEDDERVRRYSVEALEELGYAPIAVDHGAAALEVVARESDLSLLFTDIVMPGMSGPQLAAAVQAARPDLKILYTTGYARDALPRSELLEQGAAVLAKPFTVAQLAAKLREVIDTPALL